MICSWIRIMMESDGYDMQLYWATLNTPPPDLLDELPLLHDGQAPPPVLVPASAFRRYDGGGATEQVPRCVEPSGKSGVHKRVIEFLRAIPMRESRTEPTGGGSRCFRHMMRERQRRERQSQSYADLHSMLSPGCKADKISILRCAVLQLRELKATESKLRRRNQELRERVAAPEDSKRIKLTVGRTSPVDSAIACLQCIERMDVKMKSFLYTFPLGEMSTAVETQTEMAAKEVERCLRSLLVKETQQRHHQRQLGT